MEERYSTPSYLTSHVVHIHPTVGVPVLEVHKPGAHQPRKEAVLPLHRALALVRVGRGFPHLDLLRTHPGADGGGNASEGALAVDLQGHP